MKQKSLLILLWLALSHYGNAQTTVSGSFLHGGITRNYSFYVPAAYVPGVAVPMLIGLHGTSSNGSQFAQYRDFRPIADTANFVVVHPDGSSLFGISFWNYGNVFGSTVDDVGFIEALIDTISAQYSVNTNRIYCTGMSNGAFMSYTLACETDRFAAIAGVTGSMAVSTFNNCVPVRPTPAMHIHGTDDSVNPYMGTSTMKPIEEVVRFWVDQNNCDAIPAVFPVVDLNTSDGATAEQYVYTNGVNGHTVEHFKVINGEHTWPGSPMPGASDITCMDFDAREEIWRFFSQYEKQATNSIPETIKAEQLQIYPNPARGAVHLRYGDHEIHNVKVYDVLGREAASKQSSGTIESIHVGHL